MIEKTPKTVKYDIYGQNKHKTCITR